MQAPVCRFGSCGASLVQSVLFRPNFPTPQSNTRESSDTVFVSVAASCPCVPQDFTVSTKTVWELWQHRKMSAEDCKQELLKSRHMAAVRYMNLLDTHIAEERRQLHLKTLELARGMVEQEFTRFRGHPLLDEFMAQFQGPTAKPLARYRCLLLRGESRAGKTQRALSLFGSECTLSVNCQGVSPGLPCIKTFTKSRYAAILWDEIDEQQVLQNKLCFQSGLQVVTLGQSACNAFAYDVLLHAVPMLLCSNTFSMTTSRGKDLPPEDAQWLAMNIIEVRLAEGEKWYLADGEQ